jgi:hypothetical protein
MKSGAMAALATLGQFSDLLPMRDLFWPSLSPVAGGFGRARKVSYGRRRAARAAVRKRMIENFERIARDGIPVLHMHAHARRRLLRERAKRARFEKALRASL